MFFKKLYLCILFATLLASTHLQAEAASAKDSCVNPILLISTINGRVHAIEIDDSNESIQVLWSMDTERLISSSIDKLELYNDDNSLMRIIPSLDGNLFAYYPASSGSGDHLEKIPFNLDDLLKTSIKLNNKITIIGGILTTMLGVDLRNGQLLYNCSSHGCDTSTLTSKIKLEHNDESFDSDEDEMVKNLLVIKQSKNLLRAISIESGFEKWNISLIKNEILRHPMCNRNLQSPDRQYNFERIKHIKNQLRFNVSKGSIKYRLSSLTNKIKNFNLINLNSPIATCDILLDGILKPINIFSTTKPDMNANNGLVEFSANRFSKPARANSIYIGHYDTQHYAQSTRIEDSGDSSDIIDDYHKSNFKRILENRDQLLKTKSTSNLAVFNNNKRKGSQQNHNSLVLFKKKNNYEAFLSSAVIGEQKKNLFSFDKDYDDNDNGDEDDVDYENSPNYSLLVPDEGLLLFNDNDHLFFNTNLNNYVYMINSSKQVFKDLLNLFAVVFVTLFIVRRRRRNKEMTAVASAPTEDVLISPPSKTSLLNHQSSSKTNSSSMWNETDIQRLSIGSDDLSDMDSDSESSKSRYLSEFDHIRLIGKGGFGYVFEAKHRLDERVFAIKRIRLKNRKDAKDKVLREVRTLAKLESPYIVRYFHSWFEKHTYEWQRKIDKEKLLKENGGFMDEYIGTTTTNSFSKFSETNETTATESRNNFKLSLKKQKVDNTSSSFIVFEEEEEEEKSRGSTSGGQDEVDWDDEDEQSVEDLPPVKTAAPENEALYIYIQMELCQRETLRHWLDRFKNENRGRLQIFTIFEQILNAISYIHSQELIHRDLKPSNIFLSLDGKMIKIGDFGLVVSAEQQLDDDEESNENAGKKRSKKSNDGTYLYMSPEQLNGLDYDHKVDIYSLGIILFELVCSFSTQMERIDALKKLNKGVFPVNFENKVECKLVQLLINESPTLRPNSSEIVKHELFTSFKYMYMHTTVTGCTS